MFSPTPLSANSVTASPPTPPCEDGKPSDGFRLLLLSGDAAAPPADSDCVHVWSRPLTGPVHSGFRDLLSEEECAAASRFHTPELAERYRQAHGWMRSVLSRYLDTPPETLQFRSGPDGKPRLAHGSLHFNLAHSDSLALLGVQLILPASGWALTGRDVALKADQVDTSRTSDMSMAMIIKRGDQQLVRFMAMKKKKFPDSEKQHIRFLEPGDIRNTAYLTWSYRDINKDDDMWVYMPAESLVRRISGGSKKGSFMRSDYANEDISRREVDKDTYTLLPDEALSGVDCHVLEAKAVFPEKTNYSKRIIWIRKDIWLPAKIDFYDQGGNRCKELVFGGYKEIQGIWTATRQRMRTVGSDSETIMEIREVAYNTPIAEDIFLPQDLKR